MSVKKWLLRKKHQIELARKRGWKGYWVCLKGTTLLFYPCDSREGRSVEAAPKHLIIVDGAIMQPIPEHPKRDYIFCLSTAFGDAYLFQAPCQVSSTFFFHKFLSLFVNSTLIDPLNGLYPIYSQFLKLTSTVHFLHPFICSVVLLQQKKPCENNNKKHHCRWNWKTGSTVYIQLALQLSHVIVEKREHCTYFRKKFSVWIKLLNRYLKAFIDIRYLTFRADSFDMVKNRKQSDKTILSSYCCTLYDVTFFHLY